MNQTPPNPLPDFDEKHAMVLADVAGQIARSIDDTILARSLELAGERKLSDDDIANAQFSSLMLVIIHRTLRAGIPFEHLAAGLKHSYDHIVQNASRPGHGG